MNREKIKSFLTKLNDNDYNNVCVAILLYLRSDLDFFDKITDEQLYELYDMVRGCNSLLELDFEEIDEILESEVEE